MKKRIQTLDGLRFIAALGVLWIHSWTVHGNPRAWIGVFDVTNVLALGGNGVDLFFVISGFCMYLFYGSKQGFSSRDFCLFLVRRWIRLSPAFYFATVVYLIFGRSFNHQPGNFAGSLFHSIFYLDHLFSAWGTAAHFWTLTVEWQFYFLLSFFLLYENRIGFRSSFLLLFGSVFILGALSAFFYNDLYLYDIMPSTIIFRAVEFGCGIAAARLFLRDGSFFKRRRWWLIAFIAITYGGRILQSQPFLLFSGHYYNLLKIFAFSAMGAGFAGILYLSVTSERWLFLILSNRVFSTMGRISYSFYLFHLLVISVISPYTLALVPLRYGILAPVLTTLVSAVVLYPVSLLSYHLLERPFLSWVRLRKK